MCSNLGEGESEYMLVYTQEQLVQLSGRYRAFTVLFVDVI